MTIDDVLNEQRKALAEAEDFSVYGTAEAMHSLRLEEKLFATRQELKQANAQIAALTIKLMQANRDLQESQADAENLRYHLNPTNKQ